MKLTGKQFSFIKLLACPSPGGSIVLLHLPFQHDLTDMFRTSQAISRRWNTPEGILLLYDPAISSLRRLLDVLAQGLFNEEACLKSTLALTTNRGSWNMNVKRSELSSLEHCRIGTAPSDLMFLKDAQDREKFRAILGSSAGDGARDIAPCFSLV